MDERQQRIVGELLERGRSDLASMYRAALVLLAQPAEEGDERTRISQICHSMREVMNRVLGAMGATPSPRVRPPSHVQVQSLPDLLSQFPGLSLDGDGDSIPVPRDVAVVFDKLIKTAVQEKRRSRDDIASFLTDDGNSDHPAVKRWNEATRFFAKWAHLREEPPDPSTFPDDDVLRSNVAVFEELFDAVITVFFERLHSIEDMLAEINAVEEGGDE